MYFWEEFGFMCAIFGGLFLFFALCLFLFCGTTIIVEQQKKR